MRILVATTPEAGHVNPFIPLVKALLTAGHSVLWYTSRRFESKITALGATFLPFERATDIEIGQVETIFPERAKHKGLAQIKFDLKNIFIANFKDQTEDLLAICLTHQPDLLFVDIGMMAAIAIKHRLKIPVVGCNVTVLILRSPNTAPFGFGLPPSSSFTGQMRNRFLYWLLNNVIMNDVQQAFNAQLAAMKLPPLDEFLLDAVTSIPDLLLQPTTPLFEYPRPNLPDNLHFIGPILPTNSSTYTEPDWWPDLNSNKPVLLVTQGTIATDPHRLILPTIEALAHEDVLVIVTTANRPVAELGPLPANVRAEPFIPYDRLLPHVDLLVTNGGYGTVHMALAHGVPLVAAGNTEEKAEICARIAWAGVGINLKTDTPSPKKIHQAVLQVLNTPTYRQNANRLRCNFARYNAPLQAVALIENLVDKTSPPQSLDFYKTQQADTINLTVQP